ncbi:unnamed protein product [Allacma fusca]|uniref:Uncharacterized protein n=1 Tax=Allacma fusca TaxID=39272 RepID=A0A8J2PC30_9HEXA|nr:unnamed protein product [Allacma fusca]
MSAPGSNNNPTSSSTSSKGCYTIDGILFKPATDPSQDQLFDLSHISGYNPGDRPLSTKSQSPESNALSGNSNSPSHNDSLLFRKIDHLRILCIK